MRQLKISNERLTIRSLNTNRYFTEIERVPLLSADDEFEIAKLAMTGDEAAIQKLINANLRFVVSVAKQYMTPHMGLDELLGPGNIGLCDAARTFDPHRGFKFISYAVWLIRKEILLYINNDAKMIRVPANLQSDANQIKRIDGYFLQTEGRPVTEHELLDEFKSKSRNITESYIKSILNADITNLPFDSSAPDDMQWDPSVWVSSDSDASSLTVAHDMQVTINHALSKLNPVQRDIVKRHLGIGQDYKEQFTVISKDYDKTSEWARTVYRKAISIMRARLRKSNKPKRLAIS